MRTLFAYCRLVREATYFGHEGALRCLHELLIFAKIAAQLASAWSLEGVNVEELWIVKFPY